MKQQEAFTAALRKVLSVSKDEMQRRLEAEKKLGEQYPLEMRLKAVAKRPKRKAIHG